MLAKRIIPCLDVENGRVVKGVRFRDIRDAGDPVELARRYYEGGADEICLLDIGASYQNRDTLLDVVERTAEQVFVPLTVGGGIRSLDDVRAVLKAGADKVSIGTAAIDDTSLVSRASRKFGSQCVVISVDAMKSGDTWVVCKKGGREKTDIDALRFARDVESLGAGEILLNAMDSDGTRGGYALELTKRIVKAAGIPVIASGGAGGPHDILEVFRATNADAALAASIFHYDEYSIGEVKEYLRSRGIEIRK